MEFKLIASENFKTVRWSGGTTTELFIFPEKADYQKRNFQFRLSTSTVDSDESDFTLLSGISRKLMVLSGNIILTHENHYTKKLNEFDIDEFEGEWKTRSSGKCTDFNLMTSGETTSKLAALVVEKNMNVNYNTDETFTCLFIYAFTGKVSLMKDSESIELKKGDLLVLSNPGSQTIEIKGIEFSNLVICMIKSL